MDPVLYLLGAVVAGAVVQNFMTFRQATAFSKSVHDIRTAGRTTGIGVGGRRYRGGRAYVAIAVDDRSVVRQALTLQGFTTFARATPLPEVVGLTAARLAGDAAIPGLSKAQRAAATQAAEIMLRPRLGKQLTSEYRASQGAVPASEEISDQTTTHTSGSASEAAV